MKKMTQGKKWTQAIALVPAFIFCMSMMDLHAENVQDNRKETNVAGNQPANSSQNNATIKALEARVNQLAYEVDRLNGAQGTHNDNSIVRADLYGESPDEMEFEHGRRDTYLTSSSEYSCYPRPRVSVHGIIRVDAVTMDRVPQFGNVIQPYTIQVPLNIQKDRRHHETIIDARWSTFSIDVSHKICDTKIFGMIEVGFDTSTFGVNAVVRDYPAGLSQAFIRADFPSNWYFEAGLTYDLITVRRIANPLILPICEGRTPAGMTYTRTPLVRIGGNYDLCNCMGEIDYFIGVQQQLVWPGHHYNSQIALSPIHGEPLVYPLLAAGLSWENWEPLQVDVRFGVCQNRFAIGGSRRATESAAWLGKVSVQSQICGPTLYASYTYMDGMSRFAELSFPDAVVDGDLDIKNVRGHGAFAGAWFDVYCGVKCNTMFGWAWAKPIGGTAFSGQMTNQYRTGQICFWKEFWGSYAAAVEYKRWDIKACDGDKGQLNLFMGTLFFFF